MPYFHSSPSMSPSSSGNSSSSALYFDSSGSHSAAWPGSCSSSSYSSHSTQPSLSGFVESVGKMSKQYPAPLQFGVGHIQKPGKPSLALITRWNHISLLMNTRLQCRQ